ncbi:ATP-dependent dethiobiotin synthetase BioD [Gemmobacter sp. 24YEA27]|uniref:ATP-dependent dethiobiotin synthetase BioD n=1 Tax=Gemmobacter sp. 24YEA27 TaxID=3040672 RepID=UPI0032C44E7C
MSSAVIITGTDTGIGKTVFSAGLTLALQASYWKPVQAGLDEETDSETVARLTGRPTLPEAYRLKLPASPHHAAAREGVRITAMSLPRVDGPLVVEGAGGRWCPWTAVSYTPIRWRNGRPRSSWWHGPHLARSITAC